MEPTIKEQIYQYCFGISAGLAAMTVGAWLGWPLSTINHLEQKGTLTVDQSGTMVALLDFGNIVSPLPTAYLMDAIGRKQTLMITLIVNFIASASVLFYEHAYLIYLARLMAGIGKGICFAVIPVFMAEISHKRIRGSLSTIFTGSIYAGMMYSYLIGPYTTYVWYNVFITAMNIVFTATIIIFPESPYYLLMKGNEAAANEALKQYRVVSDNDQKRIQEVEVELLEMAKRVGADMKNKKNIYDLVAKIGNRRALIIVALLAVFQRGSGASPILAYSNKTLPQPGGGLPVSTYMILFSVVGAAGNFFALPIIDRVGRKPLLLISSAGTGIMTTASAIFYTFQNEGYDVSNFNWVPYAGLILYSTAYGFGIGVIPSILVGELFPINVKSYASCVTAITLAAVSCIDDKLFQVLYTSGIGIQYMYFSFAFMSFACFWFSWVFVFETKNKTFTEIQNMLQGKGSESKELKC